MNVDKLHEVIREIRLAQTWCDSDGTHTACVSISKGKLREWAKSIEDALANVATLGPETCKRVFYEPTGVYVCSKCGCGLSKKLDKYCYLNYCPNCGRKVIK